MAITIGMTMMIEQSRDVVFLPRPYFLLVPKITHHNGRLLRQSVGYDRLRRR